MFVSHLSIFGDLSHKRLSLARRGAKFVRQAFGYKTRVIHKYACKPTLFRTRWEDQGARQARLRGERIYGFPVEAEAASWVMLAVEENTLLRGGDKINRHSLLLVESRARKHWFPANGNCVVSANVVAPRRSYKKQRSQFAEERELVRAGDIPSKYYFCLSGGIHVNT